MRLYNMQYSHHEFRWLPSLENRRDLTNTTVTGGKGAQARNLRLMSDLKDILLSDGYYNEKKTFLRRKLRSSGCAELKKVLLAMYMEYCEVVETSDFKLSDIAIIDFIFVKNNATMALSSALLLFHNGEILHLRHDSSTSIIEAKWDNKLLDTTEFLELKTKKDFVETAKQIHSSLSNDEYISMSGFLACPQSKDIFTNNHRKENRETDYCWTCDVSVVKVEPSLCAGCLVARYCSLHCQEWDWDRHGAWCKYKTWERGIEKKRAWKDLMQDNHVD